MLIVLCSIFIGLHAERFDGIIGAKTVFACIESGIFAVLSAATSVRGWFIGVPSAATAV